MRYHSMAILRQRKCSMLWQTNMVFRFMTHTEATMTVAIARPVAAKASDIVAIVAPLLV